MTQSLQDTYAPESVCFGCGPANPQGLHIKSHVEGSEVVADFTPAPYHHAAPGVLNGGIIGALLDCHSNWTAAWHLMRAGGLAAPPCTVTAELAIKLRRPTPLDQELHLRSTIVAAAADRATVDATIEAGGVVTATCRGVFVAVREGHPAFHRW